MLPGDVGGGVMLCGRRAVGTGGGGSCGRWEDVWEGRCTAGRRGEETTPVNMCWLGVMRRMWEQQRGGVLRGVSIMGGITVGGVMWEGGVYR